MNKNSFSGTRKGEVVSPLGWPDTIAKISQKNVSDWHKKNYGKGNFFIVIGGNIDGETLQKIKNFLKGIPVAEKKKGNFGTIPKPKKLSVTKTADEIGDPHS